MKSLNELMHELGFNKNAPIETQKAFIKNLIQTANAQSPRQEPATTTPQPAAAAAQKKSRQTKKQIKEQLEFNFGEIDRVS